MDWILGLNQITILPVLSQVSVPIFSAIMSTWTFESPLKTYRS